MVNLELWNKTRKQKKITLTDLSQLTGIALSTIKEIFRGATTDPRLETVQRIERALGLEEEKTPSDGLSEDERKLIELIKKLSSEEVDEISSFVDYVISKRKN